MIHPRLLLAMLFLLPILIAPSSGLAQVSQQMEIILDASGSMWGKVGSEAKIKVAKRVLVNLAESLKGRKDLELGIRVYGHQTHRKHHDCKDTKLEIPFGPPDPAKVKALAARIKAQGYTPIAYSLLEAKKDFGGGELKRTIVLITDGLESCEGDPCAVAQELAAAGLDVKLHVVGFDLKKTQLDKLKCLVEPSGGLLLGAGNAQQLADALGMVVKQALSENLVVLVQDGAGQALRAHIKVLAPGAAKPAARGGGKRIGLKLPAGTYEIQAQGPAGAMKKVTGIVLKEDEKTEVIIKLDLATVTVSGVNPAGQPVPIRAWVLSKKPTGSFQQVAWGDGETQPASFRLPPGEYRVRAQHRGTKGQVTTEPFMLKTGESKELKLTFGKARLSVSGTNPAGQPIVLRIWVLKKTPTGSYTQVKWGDSSEKPMAFDLPPGEYQLRIMDSKTKAKRLLAPFTLKDGETKEIKLTFGKAQLSVSGSNPAGQPIVLRIWVERKTPTGSFKQTQWKDATEKPAVFNLAPGDYRIRTQDKKTRERRTGEVFALKDGESKEIKLTFGKAQLSVRGASPTGQPIELRIWVERKTPTGSFRQVQWKDATEKPAVFNLAPGDYRIRTMDKKTREQRTGEVFTLKDAESKEIKLVFGKAQLSVSGVTPDGQPLALRAYVERKTPTGSFAPVTSKMAGAKPAQFDLPPGEYRVVAQEKKSRTRRVGEAFTLKNGETKEISFSFALGRLSVIGVDPEGKPIPLRVLVDVKAPTGEFRQVSSKSSSNKPALFNLPPGEYRLRAQNQKTREQRQVPGIIIEHGKEVSKKLVFE